MTVWHPLCWAALWEACICGILHMFKKDGNGSGHLYGTDSAGMVKKIFLVLLLVYFTGMAGYGAYIFSDVIQKG